jgi:hypothetical protein
MPFDIAGLNPRTRKAAIDASHPKIVDYQGVPA